MSIEAVELLRSLIRNECVNDGTPESGQEHRSVDTLREFFGVEGEVFEPAPGRQSLVYRIEGSDPMAPSLGLSPHMDVVPVERSGWTQDPFAADIVDGFIYGRGAVDMLNVTAAMAVAARPYITGRVKPRGDLLFVALADEEAGGRLGARPFTEQRWDVAQVDYMLTEVAYPSVAHAAETAIPVATGEKGAFWSILRATGTPGHGSAPYGADNALHKMIEALHGVVTMPMPVMITHEWEEFVGSLDLDDDLKQALVDPDRVDDAIDDIAVEDPLFARYAHAVTHMTISPNMLHAGMKANVIADQADTSVDIRALPGVDRADVDTFLYKAMGSARDEVEIESVQDFESTISPTGNPLWEAIADSVEEIEGHRRLLPMMMNVATDARFWRRHGTVAYGVGLYDDRMDFSEMLALFHGHDERVSVESVERTTKLYSDVFRRFLGS
ncbi:MAG: M20/M25/M40 family metallo-hydrolase [Acidimicrobiia bacterium]|jgi:acetylornithine deacetylase/succinyl-diaminopimelate desuccinylase-like protein